jgi:hypothetical protein
MSERWKFQVKIGGLWALLTIAILTLFEFKSMNWNMFLIRLVVFLVVGVFFVGYLSWKAKIKKQNN